jgi:dienelactone hydrolase
MVKPLRFEGPGTALIDQPVQTRLVNVGPGRRVRIRATCCDPVGRKFDSWADFVSDLDGRVHPAAMAPCEGTYAGVDPYGLWWSMRPESADHSPDLPSAGGTSFGRSMEPVVVTLSAEIDGTIVAQDQVRRLRVDPAVRTHDIDGFGLLAKLFLPPSGSGPGVRGVVVLGGSEGGLASATEVAAVLASRGMAALALAYHGAGILPNTLTGVPLEYVEAATGHLARHEEVAAPSVALVGYSRGAELGLLAATRIPIIGRVAGYAASSVVWPGFTAGLAAGQEDLAAAWTWHGQTVPFAVPHGRSTPVPDRGRPVSFVDSYRRALADPAVLARTVIPVEQIQGPLLLVSGGDDRLWPSREFAELAIGRLRAAGRGADGEHLHFPAAGHGIARPPGLPASPTVSVHPVSHFAYVLGGTRQANARAAAFAWPCLLAFLSAGTPP